MIEIEQPIRRGKRGKLKQLGGGVKLIQGERIVTMSLGMPSKPDD